MSLGKFLSSLLLLLLLLAFGCPTTMAQPLTYLPPSPSPSPSPGGIPAKKVLPSIEVNAINALLQLSTKLGLIDVTFSRNDCDSQQFRKTIKCRCNSADCNVIEIDFPNQRLKGRIPNKIGDLSRLEFLDLSENRLYGTIPSSFVNLSQLSTLDLSGNMLYGTIPSSFVNLSQLSTLFLEDNDLKGPLPLFISEMKSLQILFLSDNLFNGSIPPEFGSLPSLEYLILRNNLLSGRIPEELGNISSLIALSFSNNLLTGQIPQHLENLNNLKYMYLSNNELFGELPSEFGKLKSMIGFNIQGNSINGTIPDFIVNWRSLEYLLLIGNKFEGPLPSRISTSRNLTHLAITNLRESQGGSLFPKISNARDLRVLILRNCSLTGKIPDYIWQLSALYHLDLSFNNLTGGIPTILKGSFLQYIFLRRNKLNGSLPGWMLSSNKFVDVSENIFSNTTISGNISTKTNLFECCSNINDTYKKWQEVDYYCANKTLRYDHLYINCGGNQKSINGNLYEADLNPDGASTFYLSNNSAWAYSSMGKFQSMFQSMFDDRYLVPETCNISAADPSLYMTARVSPVSLKYYGFCLKEDDYIVRLHFAEIGWDTTKVKDSSNKTRRVFNVEIQGQKVLTNFNIEEEAGGVHKGITKEFNTSVSNSRLEIHLYESGKGSNLISSYGPLISAISVSRVPKTHRKKLSPVIISAIVGSVLLLALMILGLCWKLGWLGGKGPTGVEVYPGGIFNFQQIKFATNNFAADKKIGQGGFGAVYRGTLPNGTEIAVKVLSRKSKQGVREFINEMGTIYALKHPNLVRLMGCCAEENQLLLVYEYMENNSLGHALFGPEEVKPKLDWKKRVKICLDVAKGLVYLHEECKLKLIHGDIKPSNILLDKDFNAKISDFGFARPNEGKNTPDTAQIKGTQGYIAPECMKAKYSPKVDVYSFGILTLEIISGKPSSTPNSKGQTVYLLDMAYDYLRQGNPVGLLDSSLGYEYSKKEVEKIIYLGMKCINHDPNQRPTMSEVVKILEGKKKIDNILVPIPIDDLMMGKAKVAFSQTSHFASTSFEGPSDSSIYLSTGQEIDDSSFSVSQKPES